MQEERIITLMKPYENFSSWKKWYAKPKKVDKTYVLVDSIIKKQYDFNAYLGQRGFGPKQTVFNLIMDQGVSESFQNRSALRSIELKPNGRYVLDFSNPTQMDFFLKFKAYEQLKFATLRPTTVPSTVVVNEEIVRQLFKEGQIEQRANQSPKRRINMAYLMMSIAFFYKFLVRVNYFDFFDVYE